ncbi:hypothetical protein GOBAR_DD07997 [Gossypium barbadense]|nr:hypothetical protein GOBAR_DD07997 [Gossypium barbadense]
MTWPEEWLETILDDGSGSSLARGKSEEIFAADKGLSCESCLEAKELGGGWYVLDDIDFASNLEVEKSANCSANETKDVADRASTQFSCDVYSHR